MEPKHFNLLAAAAVISLVAAGVVHGAYNGLSVEKVRGQKLFEGLDKSGDRIARITLQKGKGKLTFKKGDKGWVIMERSSYPADRAKIRKLLVGLGEAELVEPKTRVPARYGILDLGDPASTEAKSTLVTLADSSGKTIADVILGKRKVGAFGRGKAGTYVRRPGNPQTWLTNANVRASVDVAEWVNPVFFRIDPAKIASLTVTEPKAAPYTIVADAKKKGTFRFEAIPDGEKLKSGVSATDMAKALQTLEMTDVQKSEKPADGDKVAKAVLVTTDGMKLDIRLRRDDSDRWMTLAVIEDGKDKGAAKKIREATTGWAFKVADWRARQTFKEPKDLFEPVKKPEAKAPPKPAAPAKPTGPEPAAGPGSTSRP